MNNQINLLPKTDAALSKAAEHYAVFRFVGIIMMSLVVFAAIVLFLLVNFSPLPKLRHEEDQLLNTMANYDTNLAKLSLYQDRISSAQHVISSRLPYDSHIDAILALIPPGVTIESFQIEEKKVSFTVTSPSLLSLNTLLINIQDTVSSKKIGTVLINSLVQSSSSNTNTLSLSFNLL